MLLFCFKIFAHFLEVCAENASYGWRCGRKSQIMKILFSQNKMPVVTSIWKDITKIAQIFSHIAIAVCVQKRYQKQSRIKTSEN